MANLNAQPDGLRIPESLIDPSIEEAVREACWGEIIKGTDDWGVLADEVTDAAQSQGHPLSMQQAKPIVDYLLQQRRSQQVGFGRPRNALNDAFATLRDQGVLAQQNFTCCGTCGTAEIGDGIDDFSHWRGYVFFHMQDTEQLLDVGSTYLNYGIFWPHYLTEEQFEAMGEGRRAYYETKSVELMNEVVVPTFERFGITVDWDGSFDTRILIGGVEYYAPIGGN